MTTHHFGLDGVDLAIKTTGGTGLPGAIHVTVLPWSWINLAPRCRARQLVLVYFVGVFGFGFQRMGAFLLPLRARELDAPLDQIGIIVGPGRSSRRCCQSGRASWRTGSAPANLRPCHTGGGRFRFAVVPGDELLATAPIQLVMGFARSTAWVASQTYVANIGEPEERAKHMGRLSFTTNGGTVVAPLVIGQVANLVGYQGSFLFMGGITLIYTVMGRSSRRFGWPRPRSRAAKAVALARPCS